MAKQKTGIEILVANELKELQKRHGMSWYDLSQTQQQEKLAARLFFIICNNARVEAKGGDPLGEFIHEMHTAMIKASNP